MWAFTTGGAVTSPPALSHDGAHVFVGSWDTKLYKVDTTTGDRVWAFATGGYRVESKPAPSDDGAHVFVSSGKLYKVTAYMCAAGHHVRPGNWCAACPNGTFTRRPNAATKCSTKRKTCPEAQFLTAFGDAEKTKDNTCTACAAGTFKAGTSGATSCTPKRTACDPGEYFAPGEASE